MKFLRLVIVLVVITSPTLASYGELRIYGGGNSGRLEFQLANGTWGTVCNRGFDDDAGDVACKQLGYHRSTDILDSEQFVPTDAPVVICETICAGYEYELTDCNIERCGSLFQCDHSQDIGVTCSDLTVAEIVGIVLGTFFFIVFISSMLALCLCCFVPSCPCYYKRRSYYNVRTVLVEQPQFVATTPSYGAAPPQYGKPVGYSTIPPSGYQPVPPPAPTTQY